MSEEFKQTVKIVRKPKVTTDDRGRSVWSEPVETANLELVSTQMLKQLIDADVDGTKERIRDAAEGRDGLLAHNTDNNQFEVISDEELQQILDDGHELHEARDFADVIDEPLAETEDPDQQLELVSTQMLRKILDPDAPEPQSDEERKQSGFDPYNSS